MNIAANQNNDFIKIIIITFMLCLLIALCSCSCDWHLKRMESKCGKLVSDTITLNDTVITKEVKTDTLFKYFQKDTVIIKEGKLVMKYYFNTHDSVVYLQGKCASDTIIKEIKVPYEKTVVKIDYFPKWLMWLLIVLGAGGLVYKFFYK